LAEKIILNLQEFNSRRQLSIQRNVLTDNFGRRRLSLERNVTCENIALQLPVSDSDDEGGSPKEPSGKAGTQTYDTVRDVTDEIKRLQKVIETIKRKARRKKGTKRPIASIFDWVDHAKLSPTRKRRSMKRKICSFH